MPYPGLVVALLESDVDAGAPGYGAQRASGAGKRCQLGKVSEPFGDRVGPQHPERLPVPVVQAFVEVVAELGRPAGVVEDPPVCLKSDVGVHQGRAAQAAAHEHTDALPYAQVVEAGAGTDVTPWQVQL